MSAPAYSHGPVNLLNAWQGHNTIQVQVCRILSCQDNANPKEIQGFRRTEAGGARNSMSISHSATIAFYAHQRRHPK